MKNIFYILILLACSTLSVSCGTEEWDTTRYAGSETIKVTLNVTASDMGYCGATKAGSPHDPLIENTIHDFFVIQYSSRGVLLGEPKKYPSEGTFNKTTVRETIELVDDPESTICFLANWNAEVPSWPDNLTEYKSMMGVVDLVDNRLPMYGIYDGGNITGDMTMNVALGRMMTRVNVTVTNNTGLTMTKLTVALTQAPRYATLYPTVDYIPMTDSDGDGTVDENEDGIQRTLRDEKITTTWDSNGVPLDPVLNDGESVTFYYYMAPNLYEEWHTHLWTEATLVQFPDKIYTDYTADLELGNDSPSVTENRDFRLYPNNNYTFNIKLKLPSQSSL